MKRNLKNSVFYFHVYALFDLYISAILTHRPFWYESSVYILCPTCRWLSNVCAMWGNLKLTGSRKNFAPPFTATARANIWKKSLPDLIYIICKSLHAQEYFCQGEKAFLFVKMNYPSPKFNFFLFLSSCSYSYSVFHENWPHRACIQIPGGDK